jgi:hypothetical protein
MRQHVELFVVERAQAFAQVCRDKEKPGMQ